MSEKAEPTIVAITQVTRLDPRGQAIPTMRIEYRIGQDGPFSLELPKSEFTAAEVKKRIQAEAVEIRNLYT